MIGDQPVILAAMQRQAGAAQTGIARCALHGLVKPSACGGRRHVKIAAQRLEVTVDSTSRSRSLVAAARIPATLHSDPSALAAAMDGSRGGATVDLTATIVAELRSRGARGPANVTQS